jgi:hypothetical protein
MHLVFLEATEMLTKQFTMTKAGIVKTPYPMTWEFTSHSETVQNLAQFETALRLHAGKGHCLLKGTIQRDLVKESRRGSTDSNSATEWVCLDFDGLPIASVHTALLHLGIKDTSYIVQYSASSGIDGDTSLRAHVFMLLDKPAAAPLIKQWLTHLNHTVPELRSAMSLTKTGCAIRWPLDISACQNDKLIYIAPPVLNGVPDPFKGKSRISLVKRKNERFSLPGTFSSEKNRDLTNKRITELREADGLPKRTLKYRVHGSVEVLVKPDGCTVTEMKQERGFVYFNLNGGDSWAYYHPENNPEFIFNFKGEPAYLTKELLPDYWQQITSQATKVDSSGVAYLAFCDRKTSGYYRGTYDQGTDTLELFQAKNETQVRHFAKQHGMPLGDYIPEWDLIYDPQDTVRVDFQNHVINRFSPSPFMKLTGLKTPTKIPPLTLKVINHALGGDPDILEHFINWCAFIIQERAQTRTAWVLHGVPGTGKGALTTKILRPLLGATNTAFKRMEELDDKFNDYMKATLLVVVDEVQTKALANERGAMAKLKNFITEPNISVRAMYSGGIEERNYTNWIFNSNMPDPVMIDKDDRRYNVGKYQPVPLKDILTSKEVTKFEQQLDAELQNFFAYLLFYPCDHVKAHTILETADRSTMISISESSIDTVVSKLLEGDFEFLIDQLPSSTQYSNDFASLNRLENYKHVLRSLLDRVTKQNSSTISREELRVMFEFIIGSMPNTPNKFTSLLKHHRIHMDKVWVDNKTVNGIRVVWKQDEAARAPFLDALQPKIAGKIVPIKAGAATSKKAAA